MGGLGNWAAVAEHVGTKGQDACRQHYYDIYINCLSFPEPMPAPSMASIDKLQVCLASEVCQQSRLRIYAGIVIVCWPYNCKHPLLRNFDLVHLNATYEIRD